MQNITDWIMCGLTTIYVVATVAILWSNKQSADAAKEQIEESKRIQEQNAALQLLNQRFDIYRTLASWFGNAKIISTGALHFKDSLPLLQSLLYNNAADNNSEKTARIAILRNQIQMPIFSNEQRLAMTTELERLEQEVFLKKISNLSQELQIIELAEVCFKAINYTTIKAFSEAYIDMAIHIGDEIKEDGCSKYIYANALSKATQEIINARVLQQMKEEMKTVWK